MLTRLLDLMFQRVSYMVPRRDFGKVPTRQDMIEYKDCTTWSI